MRFLSAVELINTRRKLRELEALYKEDEREAGGDEELQSVAWQTAE